MESTLKFIILLLIFGFWLWKFNMLYQKYQALSDVNYNAVNELNVIKNYKITGIPEKDLGKIGDNTLVIPEWNGTAWIYYQIPLKRLIIKIS